MKPNFKAAAQKYRAEAGNFNSFDGPVFSQNYMGQDSKPYGYMGQGMNANGAAPMGDIFSRLSDTDKIYTAVITNTQTSGAAVNAIVFGANQYSGSTQPNAGVTVTIQESSHAQVRAESQYSPFWVNGLRYLVTTTNQLNTQIPTVQKFSSAGTINSAQFRPLSYKTAYQQQTLQVDATDFKFEVDGSTSMIVPVVAAETVTIIFQIGGRFAPQNVVQGSSALEVASQRPLTTGLVQVNG
jgi:hypothetical protein